MIFLDLLQKLNFFAKNSMVFMLFCYLCVETTAVSGRFIKMKIISRLNSGDLSTFFLCEDILFLAVSNDDQKIRLDVLNVEKTQLETFIIFNQTKN